MSLIRTYGGCVAIIMAGTMYAPVLMGEEQGAALAGPVAADAPEPAEDNANRWFPLMKNLVAERPHLPPPYGVAVMYNWVASDWHFKSATVGIDDAAVPAEIAKDCSVDISVVTYGAKADIWVLPFLNLFAVAGRAEADNQLLLRNVPLAFRGGQVVRGDVAIDFDMTGPFYTFGGVLAGGYKKFFASVDFSVSTTDFGHKDAIESDQKATYSVAPRIGYVVGLSQIWVGSRYVDSSTKYKGTIPIPSGQNFTFDVDLETASWDLDLGIRTVLQKHWEVMLNAGVGDRQRISTAIGYRW